MDLVLFSFLEHSRSKSHEFKAELFSLKLKLQCKRGMANLSPVVVEDDSEELQADGHSCENHWQLLEGEQPGLERELDEVALGHMAAELIHIADEFQRNVVSQASERLVTRLQRSAKQNWRQYLTTEVDNVLKCGTVPGVDQEKVMVALTLTLVRGVCERVPHILRDLFDTALQCVSHIMSR